MSIWIGKVPQSNAGIARGLGMPGYPRNEAPVGRTAASASNGAT